MSQSEAARPDPSSGSKLEQRERELAILKAIAEELNRAVDVQTALENSLGLVTEFLGLKTGWVWLLDETSGEPYLAASRNLPPFLTAKPSRMRGKDCLCLQTFLAGNLTMAANVNVLECSRLSWNVDGTDGLRYHASLPIYVHGQPLGVMNLAGQDWRGLQQGDLQLLYTISYQIGLAVERARLFDQTVRMTGAEERNRLARDIHDTIAQGMAAAILNLESAELLMEEQSPRNRLKAQEKVRKALNLTRANLEEARRWVLDLRLAPFQQKSLPVALAEMVNEFGNENGLEVSFKASLGNTTDRRYPARIETGLYRVAQEALTNIRKHARAKHVWVKISLQTESGHERLNLSVQDDGIGFDPARLGSPQPGGAAEPGHWGLVGMRERARSAGGQLDIRSCPGQGTEIELSVPVVYPTAGPGGKETR